MTSRVFLRWFLPTCVQAEADPDTTWEILGPNIREEERKQEQEEEPAAYEEVEEEEVEEGEEAGEEQPRPVQVVQDVVRVPENRLQLLSGA